METKTGIPKRCLRLSVIIALFLSYPCFAQEKEADELRKLRTDIQIINLLNGLDLRKEQIEFIIQQARLAEDIRNSAYQETLAYKSQMLNSCEAIKQQVNSGRVVVEKENALAFHEAKEKFESIARDASAQIDKIAKEVEAKLEEFQLLVLDDYKPCIIPIVNKGRIGQSDAGVGITKVLERAKGSPEAAYAWKKDEFVERILDRIETKFPLGVEMDKTKTRAEINNVLEEARSMDDVDFQVKKTSIAEELGAKILPKERVLSRKDKIKSFLLTKNVIDILQEKLIKAD